MLDAVRSSLEDPFEFTHRNAAAKLGAGGGYEESAAKPYSLHRVPQDSCRPSPYRARPGAEHRR
jgi:hypothetical protein